MLSPFEESVRELAIQVRWPSIERGLKWLEDQQIVEGGQIQAIQSGAEAEARRFASAATRAFDRKIAKEVRESIRRGESGEQWQKRIANIGDFERHVGEVIHRTASHRTYYRGQRDALEELPEVGNRFPYVLYDATMDNRVRKTHAKLGQKVARVGSPMHQEMVRRLDEFNCILPGGRVEGAFDAAVRSFYSGQAVEIVTFRGCKIRVTKNHPILAEHGFVAAGSLNRGDKVLLDVVHREDVDGLAVIRSIGGPTQEDEKPPMIEEVFRSILSAGSHELHRAKAADFHGDGKSFDGDIDVVRADLELLGAGDADASEHASNLVFEMPKSGDVRGAYLACSSVRAHSRPLHPLSVGPATNGDILLHEPSTQNMPTDSLLGRERFEGFSAFVGFDQIESIETFHYAGHVFDLQSANGLIILDGVVVSNCRCSATPLTAKQAQARGIDDDTGAPSSTPGRLTMAEIRAAESEDAIADLLAKQATPPVDYKNVTMARPERFATVEVEGMRVRMSADEAPEQVRRNAARTIRQAMEANLPDPVTDANKAMTFTRQRNQHDPMWAEQYNDPDFESAATAGGPTQEITVYSGRSMEQGTYAHESGHNFARKIWGNTTPQGEYAEAQQAESPVSAYAAKSPAEDFAEAMRLYVMERDTLRKGWPRKFAAIARLIKGVTT